METSSAKPLASPSRKAARRAAKAVARAESRAEVCCLVLFAESIGRRFAVLFV